MTLPHTMLSNVLRVRAYEYVQSLYEGATMTTHDLSYCAEFLSFLPEAMAHYGLRLVNGVCERIDNNEREVAA